MDNFTETLYSKAATRKILKISRARYDQFIESGILLKPITITPSSRPLHTESQIKLASSNLRERALAALKPKHGSRPIKPISSDLARSIAYRKNEHKPNFKFRARK